MEEWRMKNKIDKKQLFVKIMAGILVGLMVLATVLVIIDYQYRNDFTHSEPWPVSSSLLLGAHLYFLPILQTISYYKAYLS